MGTGTFIRAKQEVEGVQKTVSSFSVYYLLNCFQGPGIKKAFRSGLYLKTFWFIFSVFRKTPYLYMR